MKIFIFITLISLNFINLIKMEEVTPTNNTIKPTIEPTIPTEPPKPTFQTKPSTSNQFKLDVTSALYILSIEMNNHQVIDLIIDNAYNRSTHFAKHYDISSPHLSMKILQQMLKTEPLSSFDDALEDLDITFNDFKNAYKSYNPSYKLLQQLGVSFSETVDNFLQHIKYNNEIFLKVLDLIYIDPDKFQQTLWYGNEENLYNLFGNGTYEENNLKEIFKLTKIDVNFSNLVNIVNHGTDFLEKFATNVESNFIELMKRMKVDSTNLKTAFKNFDILQAKEPTTIEPIPAILDELENVTSIATQISEYKVITPKDATLLVKYRDLAPSATILGENLADERQYEFILNTLHATESHYAILWTQDSMGSIYVELESTEKIQNQTKYTNCSYWHVYDDYISQIGTTPILANSVFVVRKQNASDVLLDGTPLFCNNKLYALGIHDSAGAKSAIFTSKYPIVKELEDVYEDVENYSFFEDTFGKIKSTYDNIMDMISTGYQILKILLRHWELYN